MPERQRSGERRCQVSSTAGLTRAGRGHRPGGRLVIGQDEPGRAIVTNFPATLPALLPDLLRAECRERGGGRGRRAADLRRSRSRFPTGSRTASSRAASPRATASRIAMRNCPAWIVSYMAILKAGGDRHAAQRLVGSRTRWSMRSQLTEPKLIIADRAARQADRRALRRAARSSACRSSSRSSRRSRRCWTARRTSAAARGLARGRRDDPLHLGLDRAMPRARCRPTAR